MTLNGTITKKGMPNKKKLKVLSSINNESNEDNELNNKIIIKLAANVVIIE